MRNYVMSIEFSGETCQFDAKGFYLLLYSVEFRPFRFRPPYIDSFGQN